MLVICGVALGGSVCGEEKLLWPLDIEISQSSSFGEQRGMRHHAGIDLRTKQQNGFPIVAIEDGFISRVGVAFRSYGKALYIDHPKLNARVVYGHLQDFNGHIKKHVDAKLASIGKPFGINDFFKPHQFPVKKGQVVGYSGETGLGPSHLHFEMRTFKDEPLAPAIFGYRPKDNIYPVFYNLYIEPMAFATVIENSFLPFSMKCIKKSASYYSLAKVPQVCGRIGIQAGAADSNGLGNVFSLEKVALVVNGRTLIERLFHKYSYPEDRQSPWVYDYFKTSIRQTGYVYNMFKWPFETIDFAKNYEAWSGFVTTADYPPGKLNFAVLAHDYGNNSIKADGAMSCARIEFNEPISDAAVADYGAFRLVQNHFSLVAVAKRANPLPGNSLVFGKIVCRDSAGNPHEQPCIMQGDSLEISFENDAKWQHGAWVGQRMVLPATTYIDYDGGKVMTGKGAEVEFKKRSLHFGAFVSLKELALKPNLQKGLVAHSPVWELTPGNIVFDTEAVVRLSPENFTGNWERLGIFAVNNNGNVSYNGENLSQGILSFWTRTGGKYVIVEDAVPPVVTYSKVGFNYDLGKSFVFKVSDLGKGVDYLGMSATVNGKKAVVYSDPDRREAYVKRPEGLSTYSIKLKVPDKAGNVATVSVKK